MNLKFMAWMREKRPEYCEVTVINDWHVKDVHGGWKARLCIFDLQAHTCPGPPVCKAWHAHLVVVCLNLGLEFEFGWPIKRACP